MKRETKRRIRRINPYIFFIGMALAIGTQYLDFRWLPGLAGLVISWPICFIIWDYKPNDDRTG